MLYEHTHTPTKCPHPETLHTHIIYSLYSVSSKAQQSPRCFDVQQESPAHMSELNVPFMLFLYLWFYSFNKTTANHRRVGRGRGATFVFVGDIEKERGRAGEGWTHMENSNIIIRLGIRGEVVVAVSASL